MQKIMFKNFLRKIFSAATVAIILLIAPAARAAEILPSCAKAGNCGLNDILLVAVNVADFILGIVGSVALLFFIYGGFVFILSGGNEKRVEEGKQILLNAVIGLVIVFASYLIIQFSLTLLGVKGAGAWSDLLKFTNTIR